MTTIIFHHGALVADRKLFMSNSGECLSKIAPKLHISDREDFAYAISGTVDRRESAHIAIDLTIRNYVSNAVINKESLISAIMEAFSIHIGKERYIFMTSSMAVVKSDNEILLYCQDDEPAVLGTGGQLYLALNMISPISEANVEKAFRKVVEYDAESSEMFDVIRQKDLKKFKLEYVTPNT